MGRELLSKCKLCRREGQKLFLKGERCNSSKCAIVKRNYVPGIHGPKQGNRTRLTGYGTQLREKQKARRTYRIMEKQFKNYFDAAIKKKGETGENLYTLLEMRFDNAVYRAGFADSRDKARQKIRHGHFQINGQKVDIPSYQLKIKDKITIKEASRKRAPFVNLSETLKNKEYPEWLTVDLKELSFTVIDKPNLEKAPPSFDLKLITEFYSR